MIKELDEAQKIKPRNKLWLIVAILFGSFYFLWKFAPILGYINYLDSPSNIYKQVKLLQFYKQLTHPSKMSDYKFAYDSLDPADQSKLSLDEYIRKNAPQSPPYSRTYTIHSIKIDGDTGLIDRTVIVCITQACSGDDKLEDRAVKKYVHINNRWYTPLHNDATNCVRSAPYTIPSEFDRALSLIIQREEGGSEDSRLFASSLYDIRNCLNIQYAQTEQDMQGVEGYFTFDTNSTNDNLRIYISPKYQTKDDLLTSILLLHEISHAMFFVGKLPYSCYENEAHAYTNQWAFMLLLNMEEKQSLVQRSKAYASSDIYNMFYQLQQIQYQRGNDWYEQSLNYVKNNPLYIKQCEN